MYIGRTTNALEHRIEKHFSDLRGHHHPVEDMQHDFDVYGDDFEVFLIAAVDEKNPWGESPEKYYIRKYGTYDRSRGYNYKDPISGMLAREVAAVAGSSNDVVRSFMDLMSCAKPSKQRAIIDYITLTFSEEGNHV
jgi:hypothetical protein